MGLKLATLTPKSHKGLRDSWGEASSPDLPLSPASAPPASFQRPELAEDAVTALTWNISAVNNNPFEYWLSYDDPKYESLMMGVECFLDDPGDDDVAVGEVFTEAMFQELLKYMAEEKMESLDEVDALWRGGDMGLSKRRIVSEVIKDRSLGAKRLISMPDRVTNTINVVTRKESNYNPPAACRPSVMNNFEGDLSTMDVWWEQWKKFMFQDKLTIKIRDGISIVRPVEMLERIKRSKYPAVTEQEERLSIPLQIVCQAVFDSIIVHLMNKLSPDDEWQVVKSTICDRLFRSKHRRIVQILAERYGGVEVMCLQEVAAVFADHYKTSSLASTHLLVSPIRLDTSRDQNSFLLLSKQTFVPESVEDVTSSIANVMERGSALSDGDLLAVQVRRRKDEKPWLIVSFHGDTSGLLTLPLIDAVHRAAKEHFPSHTVVVGLDANVYEREREGVQGFESCLQHFSELGLVTCWGEKPEAKACRTTCSARTSLQPQLNKAVRFAERVAKSSRDPKDFVVFYQGQLRLVAPSEMGVGKQPNPMRDNTGQLEFRDSMNFPTLDFPSDHGLVAMALTPVAR
uniref:Endonuclease/exonuclease/phosphatase domain-containing protein n=1 Tax=Alexandrium catenella TaxID=2925 RepID=A0A7S1QLZ8_ALECA